MLHSQFRCCGLTGQLGSQLLSTMAPGYFQRLHLLILLLPRLGIATIGAAGVHSGDVACEVVTTGAAMGTPVLDDLLVDATVFQATIYCDVTQPMGLCDVFLLNYKLWKIKQNGHPRDT